MNIDGIRRIDFGHFIRPGSETLSGEARVESLLGYLIAHPAGYVLFDTGLAVADAETEAHYRPHRRALAEALRGAGSVVEDVRWVVNCHLHFDHCGGNPAFAGRPIVVQSTELASAHAPDYTVPAVVDFTDANYQVIDGELELLPGLWVIPTPGHTAGHQSVVVLCDDGTVVLAGQARDTATEFAAGPPRRTERATARSFHRTVPGWTDFWSSTRDALSSPTICQSSSRCGRQRPRDESQLPTSDPG